MFRVWLVLVNVMEMMGFRRFLCFLIQFLWFLLQFVLDWHWMLLNISVDIRVNITIGIRVIRDLVILDPCTHHKIQQLHYNHHSYTHKYYQEIVTGIRQEISIGNYDSKLSRGFWVFLRLLGLKYLREE
jgi:hypothetical protein